MAGRGRVPKDPERIASQGHRKAAASRMRVVVSEPKAQPELPECMPTGEPWPEQTRVWWRMWGEDPLSEEFRATDWSELLDTAVIHGRFWSGDPRVAGELRLRTQRMGATAEDRARLRVQYASADAAEEKRPAGRKSWAESRYPGLRCVDDPVPDSGA